LFVQKTHSQIVVSIIDAPVGKNPEHLRPGGAEQEKAGNTNKEISLLTLGDEGIRQE
jgi:hypothetical protein